MVTVENSNIQLLVKMKILKNVSHKMKRKKCKKEERYNSVCGIMDVFSKEFNGSLLNFNQYFRNKKL